MSGVIDADGQMSSLKIIAAHVVCVCFTMYSNDQIDLLLLYANDFEGDSGGSAALLPFHSSILKPCLHLKMGTCANMISRGRFHRLLHTFAINAFSTTDQKFVIATREQDRHHAYM